MATRSLWGKAKKSSASVFVYSRGEPTWLLGGGSSLRSGSRPWWRLTELAASDAGCSFATASLHCVAVTSVEVVARPQRTARYLQRSASHLFCPECGGKEGGKERRKKGITCLPARFRLMTCNHDCICRGTSHWLAHYGSLLQQVEEQQQNFYSRLFSKNRNVFPKRH